MESSALRLLVRKRMKIFMGLSAAAFFAALYLLYLHFEPSASTLCTLGEKLDCGIVNKSKYSEIFDIPVSLLGAITYLLLFLTGLGIVKDFRFQRFHKWLRPLHVMWLMFALTAFGVCFSLYLTYIEAFVLRTWCIFCVTQQVLIVLMLFVLLGILSAIDAQKKKNPDVCEFC